MNSARIFHNLLVIYLLVLCVGMNNNCLPQSLAFENLVPCWWHCLLRLMRYGLEGTSLEAGFESLKTCTTSRVLSWPPVCD